MLLSAEPVGGPLQIHNVEAEQALLGAILVEPDVLDLVCANVEAVDFYLSVHGRIFDAMLVLHDRGDPIEPVTLKTYFERDDALADVEGGKYLLRLAHASVTVRDAPHYAVTVHDLAVRRRIATIGLDMQDTAGDPNVEADATALLEQAARQVLALQERAAGAGHVSIGDIARQVTDTADRVYREGVPLGLQVGLKAVDVDLGGLHPGLLYVVAARPGMGKTALMLTMAMGAARRGHAVGITSLEMTAEQLVQRALAGEIDMSAGDIAQARLEQDDFDRLERAAVNFADLAIDIDDHPSQRLGQIQARARLLQRRGRLSIVMVDYLQLIQADRRAERRDIEIGEYTRGLKALAKDLKVPVVVLCQLSRAVEARQDKRPQLSDLRESGNIEQDADVVLFVYREEYYVQRARPESDTPAYNDWLEKLNRCADKAELIIGKQRGGATGVRTCRFLAAQTRFEDLYPHDEAPA